MIVEGHMEFQKFRENMPIFNILYCFPFDIKECNYKSLTVEELYIWIS